MMVSSIDINYYLLCSEEGEVKVFVRRYLRRDGLFLIRLVSKNSSDLIAAELVSGLWQHYQVILYHNILYNIRQIYIF